MKIHSFQIGIISLRGPQRIPRSKQLSPRSRILFQCHHAESQRNLALEHQSIILTASHHCQCHHLIHSLHSLLLKKNTKQHIHTHIHTLKHTFTHTPKPHRASIKSSSRRTSGWCLQCPQTHQTLVASSQPPGSRHGCHSSGAGSRHTPSPSGSSRCCGRAATDPGSHTLAHCSLARRASDLCGGEDRHISVQWVLIILQCRFLLGWITPVPYDLTRINLHSNSLHIADNPSGMLVSCWSPGKI